MSNHSDVCTRVPGWVLRPLPANATIDRALLDDLEAQAADLPHSLSSMGHALSQVAMYREYDAAANLACAHVWQALDRCLSAEPPAQRAALVSFAAHMPPRARYWIWRHLAKDPDPGVRKAVRRFLSHATIREVALPSRPEGDWNASGWLRGAEPGRLFRHRAGERIQSRHGLPPVANLRQLRELLGIYSPRQLGYLLLASDANGGPYTRFTLNKRDGARRTISAPSRQLKWVQRRMLQKILERIPVHRAAHGFVPGRSTVTNATPHQGAALIVKFDLCDFFPTIHYNRVLGLFASLGYSLGDGRFGTDDDSRQVAPCLARLCTYTPEPRRFGVGVLPQGAPTSPAISNLICRALDARLDGLARRSGGTYTRYADDLTFSFPAADLDLARFRWWVDQICQQEGFLVNQRKFRVIRRSQRQTVTGIVVNDSLRIPRRERRRLRAILHNCRVHGIESQRRGNLGFANHLRGLVSYIQMVHPEEGRRFLTEVNELLHHQGTGGPELP